MTTKTKCNHVDDGTDKTPEGQLLLCSICRVTICLECGTESCRWEWNENNVGVWVSNFLCNKCLIDTEIPF